MNVKLSTLLKSVFCGCILFIGIVWLVSPAEFWSNIWPLVCGLGVLLSIAFYCLTNPRYE